MDVNLLDRLQPYLAPGERVLWVGRADPQRSMPASVRRVTAVALWTAGGMLLPVAVAAAVWTIVGFLFSQRRVSWVLLAGAVVLCVTILVFLVLVEIWYFLRRPYYRALRSARDLVADINLALTLLLIALWIGGRFLLGSGAVRDAI